MPEQFWWFVARASGMVTLATSAGTVVWGLLLSTRLIRKRSLPKWLLDLHRFLGAMTIAFLALHLAALVADNFVHFGPADLAIPFHSAWKRTATAWGVIGAYLLVAVEVTSLLRERMSRTWWRRVHASSFVAFVLSVVHAVTAGTDASNRVFVVVAFVSCTVVVFLTIVRFLPGRARGAGSRGSTPAPRPAARRGTPVP